MRKDILIIGVVIILLVALLFYSLGDENLGIVERITSGAEKTINLVMTPGGSTDDGTDTGDDDTDDTEDDTTPTGSWHTLTFQGSGVCAAGDSETSTSPLTGIPAFASGSSKIIITVYTIWSDPNGCSPCDPGVVWCVHDSTGAQVYHATEPSPKITTATIYGVWDGTSPWSAFIGNNCACDINYAFHVTVKWYG